MTTGGGALPPSPLGKATPYQLVRRLQRAAAHSDAQLIAEVAAVAEGWAVLVNRGGRAVHSSPPDAAAEGIRAAERPLAYRHLIVRKMTDSTLVIKPGSATPRKRVALIQSTAVDLLRLRATTRQVEESHRLEQRQHRAVLALLLAGQARLAAEVLGCNALTHATVYRLTGEAAETAYRDLWRTVHPPGPPASPRTLVCLQGTELTVIALHDRHGDSHQRFALMARIADQHRLAGGTAEPVPLDMLPTAWAEAATARSSAAGGCLAPATGLGAYELLHVIPPDRLAVWSAQVLHPLTREQRKTLEAYLRAGSAAGAASALAVAEGTVRLRLRNASTALAVELDDPGTQALLLLAVRAPASHPPPSATRRLPSQPCVPPELLRPERARRWASQLLEPLDRPLRIALRCWLAHRGRTAPAAAELNLSRSTLTQWLARCSEALGLDLASAAVRAELHLAAETLATADDNPATLPRRGGRTYRT